MKMEKIKVGIIGVGRGMSFTANQDITGLELVALCDTWEEKLTEAGQKLNAATYTNYDEFLKHDMDAVILANYFDEHASFAIKALESGKHVMSETSANSTMAEGVALCRAVEKSGLIYMLAENYAYTANSQEMRRLYQAGEIGEVRYAEGEYNHPVDLDFKLRLAPGKNHWRLWLPSTYYCTHALAPLMYITDTMPKRVSAYSITDNIHNKLSMRVTDPGSVILCRMDNGAMFRIFGLMMAGHSYYYRLHGERGAVECTRNGHWGDLRVWLNEWDLHEGEAADKIYTPQFPELADIAATTGHGGGDFFVNYHFANAIRTGKQPYLDVYKSVAMSSVGILGWRSALEEGMPFDMPDFSSEESRKFYENDNWSPFPKDKGKAENQPPPSIRGFITPDEESEKFAKKIWSEMGCEE
jgi:predicted dehydrogenase